MRILSQAFFTLLGISFSQDSGSGEPQQPYGTSGHKSIAIVGAGTAGLAALKSLLDLPIEVRNGWEIILYEQRRGVGGVWLPDVNTPNPPQLPETPLYPGLRTNVPHPTMTFPDFPFPPGTPLIASHVDVLAYHESYAAHYNLTAYIRLNHTVLRTSWEGDASAGWWKVRVRRRDEDVGQVVERKFDHLIVASGHNHYPRVPHWEGLDEWLQGGGQDKENKREALHSIYYRDPSLYANRTVVVVGDGASGRDVALQVAPVARKTYHSINPNSILPVAPPAIRKPRITRFNSSAVIFDDGSATFSADTLLLGTGYEARAPFLSDGGVLRTFPPSVNTSNVEGLTSNSYYIRPLHALSVPITSSLPPNALYFIGLPVFTANCATSTAQSIFAAHTIANSSLLPSRDEMLTGVLEREEGLRQKGFNPLKVGHYFGKLGEITESKDYEDGLVAFLRARGARVRVGAGREDGAYNEPWRRESWSDLGLIMAGWKRVEKAGEAQVREWLDGVETEGEWAGMMRRLAEWERKKQAEEKAGGSLSPQLAYPGQNNDWWLESLY
ncbi:hypothetical protein BOTBODRAFT_57875 [Botryobasidium botryosum FD-172 SS1]|uniref:FAD/NAD(P)-binding domain-containing protein n=1 Tax=Botryobasidium botryosum (strain FD-172 SS1) TaxID=930990 RepID=A0A067M4D3_BOTB1|nr:hypothetical protein BOTBODRAFT_57875 [Botryobasidium botryosum FD-172 SS1]